MSRCPIVFSSGHKYWVMSREKCAHWSCNATAAGLETLHGALASPDPGDQKKHSRKNKRDDLSTPEVIGLVNKESTIALHSIWMQMSNEKHCLRQSCVLCRWVNVVSSRYTTS